MNFGQRELIGGTEMSEKRNQVNVRLRDDENELLTQVSSSLGISKSEAVRLSLVDNLREATEHRTMMSAEERQLIIRELAGVMNELNHVEYELNKIGVNVNQIAKSYNRKKLGKYVYGSLGFEKDFYKMKDEFNKIDGWVFKLWELLA